MEIGIFTMQIGLALAAGLLMGLERELKGKSAGLKTQGLVALGACAFVSLSMNYAGEQYVDMTRVLSQVVIGIGFLGGGSSCKREIRSKALPLLPRSGVQPLPAAWPGPRCTPNWGC